MCESVSVSVCTCACTCVSVHTRDFERLVRLSGTTDGRLETSAHLNLTCWPASGTSNSMCWMDVVMTRHLKISCDTKESKLFCFSIIIIFIIIHQSSINHHHHHPHQSTSSSSSSSLTVPIPNLSLQSILSFLDYFSRFLRKCSCHPLKKCKSKTFTRTHTNKLLPGQKVCTLVAVFQELYREN